MLKALRIASMAAVITAVVVLAAVAILGFQGDPDIEAFLAKEGVVEQFRKKSQTVPAAAKTDALSPLEQAAKSFALRIDPPPPPPPPKPIEPPKPPEVKQPVTPPRPPENKQPTLSAKFTLIATARYPDHPEKSMALLQNVQNEYKWYRQGEQVGHLVIQEIKDGSIVLYQGGKFNSELFMPAAPPTKSLLKSDEQIASAVSTKPSSAGTTEVSAELGAEADSSAAFAEGKTPSSRPSVPRIPRPQPTSASPRITSALRTAEELPAVEMSPEEQIRSIDESISAIETIMRQSPQEGQTEEERQAEQQAWQELLKVLAKEKETAMQSAQQAKKPSEQSAEESAGKKEEAKPAPPEESPPQENIEKPEGSEKIE